MTIDDSTAFRTRIRNLEDDSSVSATQAHAHKRPTHNPRRMLALTFVILILVGTFLLMTPWSQSSGHWAWLNNDLSFEWSFAWRQILNNFFLATSASCVTGLSVVDITTYYSPIGQTVLLCCIQLGGLGIMTVGTFLMALLMGRMNADTETQLMISYGATSVQKAHFILFKTLQYVFGFEAIGATILFCRYYFNYGYEIWKAMGFAIFHAVSAFCNAGLSLHQNNLISLADDTPFILTITALVVAGSLGFFVISNLFQYKFWRKDLRIRGRITLHSRLVLWMTLGLLLIGGGLFTFTEWPRLISPMNPTPLWDSLSQGNFAEALITLKQYGAATVAGISQSAMMRTAGFNMLDMGTCSQAGNLVSVLLMLIGGSPGSMAGGMKTTTVLMLFLTMHAMIHGRQEVQIHRRTIPHTISREAMVIIFFYLLILFVFYFVLLLTEKALIEGRGDFALFYEITSAFGTVGASLDATQLLSPIGKVLIALAMFLGRLGPISIAMMMAHHYEAQSIRYPEENISVG